MTTYENTINYFSYIESSFWVYIFCDTFAKYIEITLQLRFVLFFFVIVKYLLLRHDHVVFVQYSYVF